MKIEKDQIFLSTAIEKIMFHKRRAGGHYLAYLKNRFQWYWNPPLGIVSRFPPHLDIEVSTYCNMVCPMCPRRIERFKRRVKQQFMEKDVFEKIIEESARKKLFSARLSLRGEPFMHPQIFEYIELAKKSGIKELSLLTNGLLLTPEKFEKLIELKFDWLTISFDGLGDIYESIRKPAKFKESLEKIKAYSEIKKRLKTSKPAIRIQTVWPAIKENPGEFYKAFSPYADSITSNPLIDFSCDDRRIEYDKEFKCPYLYQRLVIGVDGRVLLCCCDDYGDYIIGNVGHESISDIWHGEKINEARQWFNKRSIEWWGSLPCKYCFYPRKKERAKDAIIAGRRVNIERYANQTDDLVG